MRRGALALVLAAACTAAPVAVPTPTPTPSPAPSPRLVRPSFSPERARATVATLAALGPRETVSATYRRAAGIVAAELRALGYTVERRGFELAAGIVDVRTRAPAGRTENVVASPPGFRRGRPHLVVGGHLDTVPDAPGANDNASGIAVMLELARLASVFPPKLPVVFVAFGAEERKSLDDDILTAGSHAYLDGIGRTERSAIAGFLNLDMVGNGPRVTVIGDGPLYGHTLRRARRIGVPTALTTTRFFSDHESFRSRGIPVAWLWSGEHPSLHTPADVVRVVKRAALRRCGRLAWDVLRTFPG